MITDKEVLEKMKSVYESKPYVKNTNCSEAQARLHQIMKDIKQKENETNLEIVCREYFGGVSPSEIIRLLKEHYPENFV